MPVSTVYEKGPYEKYMFFRKYIRSKKHMFFEKVYMFFEKVYMFFEKVYMFFEKVYMFFEKVYNMFFEKVYIFLKSIYFLRKAPSRTPYPARATSYLSPQDNIPG